MWYIFIKWIFFPLCCSLLSNLLYFNVEVTLHYQHVQRYRANPFYHKLPPWTQHQWDLLKAVRYITSSLGKHLTVAGFARWFAFWSWIFRVENNMYTQMKKTHFREDSCKLQHTQNMHVQDNNNWTTWLK